MRVCLTTLCLLALGAAGPSAVQAQRMVAGVEPTSAVELRVAGFGWLGAPTMNSGDAMHRIVARASAAPPAVGQADSLAAGDTHAEAGAIIGGLVGAVAGGVAFAHWTHRAGAVNNGIGTLGGTVVGAGVVGGLGAVAGLLIGSTIPD